ncbi:MAG TPA: hypothetical protein VHC67_09995 [Gaiellaceae bacterium]|jgi:hypothetical protein|nr:hypothetical protein [Gaiellaceae bacterium]
MRASYAMCWWLGDGPREVGRVEVEDGSVAFTTTSPVSRVECVSFGDLREVVLSSRLLRVERANGLPYRVASLDAPGALRELAELLAAASEGER